MSKTIKLLFAVLAMTAFVSCSNSPKGEKAEVTEAAPVEETSGQVLNINPDKTIINWTGSKIGGQHSGTLSVTSGTIGIVDGKVANGIINMDMSSIKCTDLDAGEAPKLEGHLKSPDFFDVAQYPTAKFEMTKVVSLQGDDKAGYVMYGNLTIKDVTKQVAFKANIDFPNNNIAISTPNFTINRADFNVKYGSAKFFDGLKDKAISDDISLSLVVTAE